MSTDLRWSAVDIAVALGRPHPTEEQRAVIEAPLEPLLVVAGAGSGKTETMSARVVWLIANGLVEPDQVLGLTFTRKAAGELSERVRSRLLALRRHERRTDRSPQGGSPRSEGAGSVFLAPTIATYNSYAATLVGDHALRIGVEPGARLLSEAARWQLAHDIVEHSDADLDTDLAVSTVTRALLALAGGLAEHLHDPQDLRHECDRIARALSDLPAAGTKTAQKSVDRILGSVRLRSAMVPMLEEFAARKRERDVIDFADQVALAARVAREVPEVGAGERSRFAVVLLDEYQDTSVAQLDLLRHLYGSGSGEPLPGAGHPVTAVGDPHQSIYGWRGASAGGLFRFPAEFRRVEPDGTVRDSAWLTLSTSWRNDHAVLSVANTLAAPLQDASTYSVAELGARPDAGTGEVLVEFVVDEHDESERVAQFIDERRTALATQPADANGGGVAVASAAVLCRKRSQFLAIEVALRARGLPVEVVGLGGLLSAPEVVDIVAALQAAHDPSRGDALMRLLTGPRARLGLADIAALSDWSLELARQWRVPEGRASGASETTEAVVERDATDERSIIDALDQLPPVGWTSGRGRQLTEAGRERLDELAVVLRGLRSQTFLPLGDLVAEAEVLLGLDIEVGLRPGAASAARAHLDAFRAEATRFDSEEGGTLGAFLSWLEAAESEERGLDAPASDLDPEAVQVMTVHAAKGLEWDVVAVPGLTAKSFPVSLRSSGWPVEAGGLPTALRGDAASLPDVDLTSAPDAAELGARLKTYKTALVDHSLAEERRLAYVAFTRARRSLLACGSRWRSGSQPHDPSPFLVEICNDRENWALDADRPERDEDNQVTVWPPVAPLGARQERVERAAAAVQAARSAGTFPRTPDLQAGSRSVGEPGSLAELAVLLIAERDAQAKRRTSIQLPDHISASSVVALARDPAEFALSLRRPVPRAPSKIARRGTEFHAWVERYFGQPALLDLDELLGADDVDTDADLASMREAFLASEWAGRSPIEVEVDVETPIGDVVVRSRIDAVFAEPDGRVLVVDWKTGAVPGPMDLRSREQQLAVYRIAWSRRTGLPLDQVDAAFVYVAHGVTIRPQNLPDADELARLFTRSGGGRP